MYAFAKTLKMATETGIKGKKLSNLLEGAESVRDRTLSDAFMDYAADAPDVKFGTAFLNYEAVILRNRHPLSYSQCINDESFEEASTFAMTCHGTTDKEHALTWFRYTIDFVLPERDEEWNLKYNQGFKMKVGIRTYRNKTMATATMRELKFSTPKRGFTTDDKRKLFGRNKQ